MATVESLTSYLANKRSEEGESPTKKTTELAALVFHAYGNTLSSDCKLYSDASEILLNYIRFPDGPGQNYTLSFVISTLLVHYGRKILAGRLPLFTQCIGSIVGSQSPSGWWSAQGDCQGKIPTTYQVLTMLAAFHSILPIVDEVHTVLPALEWMTKKAIPSHSVEMKILGLSALKAWDVERGYISAEIENQITQADPEFLEPFVCISLANITKQPWLHVWKRYIQNLYLYAPVVSDLVVLETTRHQLCVEWTRRIWHAVLETSFDVEILINRMS